MTFPYLSTRMNNNEASKNPNSQIQHRGANIMMPMIMIADVKRKEILLLLTIIAIVCMLTTAANLYLPRFYSAKEDFSKYPLGLMCAQ